MPRIALPASLLLILLCSCSDPPSARKRELNVKGPMLVLEGNHILNWQGDSILEIDALRDAGDGPQTGQSSQTGYPQYLNGPEMMISGPDDMYLLPFDPVQGGVPLIGADGSSTELILKRPDIEANAPQSSYPGRTQFSDNSGFIGGKPFVLYDQQQLVCFGLDGEPLWEYMAGSMLSVRASKDGRQLLISDRSGGLICLDVEGQPSWSRESVQNAIGFGERILITEMNRQTLYCLDWTGTELWKLDMGRSELPYLYTVADESGERFLLMRDGVVSCHDREGRKLWTNQGVGNSMYNMQLAPDGHVFVKLFSRDYSNNWFGGRIRNDRSSPWCWLCLDPQGRPLWRSEYMSRFQTEAIPGYDGVLFSSSDTVQGLVVLSPPE
ncbi:MAG: PQQ-binding-like beta-propeller repeat protein [bacterium]